MDSRSSGIKLLFDETVGEPIARAILDVLRFDDRYQIDGTTIKDYLGKGTLDSDWVPQVAKEGRFVITGDRGRRRDGAPLDLLIPFHGASGAFMTGKLQGSKQVEKARSVIVLWPHIVKAATGTPGMRYRMRIAGDSFSWADWPLNDAAKRRQVELLGKFPKTLWESKHVQ